MKLQSQGTKHEKASFESAAKNIESRSNEIHKCVQLVIVTTGRVGVLEKKVEKVADGFAELEARVASSHSASLVDISLSESRILGQCYGQS